MAEADSETSAGMPALCASTANGPGNPLTALGDVVNANVGSCCWGNKAYNKFYK